MRYSLNPWEFIRKTWALDLEDTGSRAAYGRSKRMSQSAVCR